jgi:hypothetical protein
VRIRSRADRNLREANAEHGGVVYEEAAAVLPGGLQYLCCRFFYGRRDRPKRTANYAGGSEEDAFCVSSIRDPIGYKDQPVSGSDAERMILLGIDRSAVA